jgi:DNA repair protein RadC
MTQGFSEATGPPAASFTSTGPQGHRERMRGRLLEKGAAALADYEILEMLLFLGIPRRDTKPLAKAMINRFGSLAAVLAADRGALLATPDVTAACTDAIGLVRQAARTLAHADARQAPVLSNHAALAAYLAGTSPAPLRILFLDSKNRLLADQARDAALLDAAATRAILRQALELHGVALLLASWRADAVPNQMDIDGLGRLRAAGAAVAVGVHDLFLVTNERMVSVGR